MKKYTVHIKELLLGTIEVEAESEASAHGIALHMIVAGEIPDENMTDTKGKEIDFVDENVCEYCNGTGEIPQDEIDADHMIARGVGTRVCDCRAHEPDDFTGASEGDR